MLELKLQSTIEACNLDQKDADEEKFKLNINAMQVKNNCNKKQHSEKRNSKKRN